MKAALFVVVLTVAAVSPPAQPAGDLVVQIVIGSQGDLKKPCMLPPTTVVVIGTEAYHCIKEQLVSHADESKNPDFSLAVPQLRVGQRIRWEAAVPFTVTRIERHAPFANGSPNDPFSGDQFPNAKPDKSVRSGTVVNLNGEVQQRYKVSFQINGVLVDPDFVCSM